MPNFYDYHDGTDHGLLIRFKLCVTLRVLSFGIMTDVYSTFHVGYIAFRLYAIWDQRKSVKILLRVVLAVTYIPVFVLGCISVKTFYSESSIPLSLLWCY